MHLAYGCRFLELHLTYGFAYQVTYQVSLTYTGV